METSNKKISEVLNKLIEINNDRIEGYETALKETDDMDLKTIFKEMALHSSNFNNELTNEILRLGVKPTEGTKNSGKIFRKWMDVKAALSGNDRKTILDSCEFGEDAALEVYNDVLKTDFSFLTIIREKVLKQKQLLQQDHNRIKGLRDLSSEIQSNHL